MHIEQADRSLKLDSPLGENVLVPVAVEAHEALSRPFHVVIDCISSRMRIDPDEILGKAHTLKIGRGDTLRRFHGMVNSLAPGPLLARDLRSFRIELAPHLWLLKLTRDLRVFQDKTAVEIIETVLKENGISAFDVAGVQGHHPTRQYCVQYRETSFDFVSRLMEEEGIYYFFTHADGSHTLKLADSTSAYTDCEVPDIPFHPAGDVSGSVESWAPRYNFRSGRWTLRDYNFKAPESDLTSETASVREPSVFDKEVYDYPGGFMKRVRGTELAGLRMESHVAGYETIEGNSGVRLMMPGTTFTLRDHPSDDQADRRVLIREVRHSAQDNSHVSGKSGGSGYENSFVCQPADVVFRPEPTTPRPVVPGPHTAMVVGPVGEEIHCDKHGRIKVQFHWDREGKSDEKSSCWLRVVQTMAGRGWGTLFTPRVGMEVVVDFLEGDPDAPLVVGCVYNGKNTPPYPLPNNKTQSGFKSRSSPGGNSNSSNELRFDDKAGTENVYFHAQRDFERVVKRDDTLTVERNLTATVEQGDQSVIIQKGDRRVNVDLGSEVTEAMTAIELKVGSNSVKIDQSGITLKGIQIKIEGSAMINQSAPMTTVEGSGMLTFKGGVVRIN